MHQIIKYKALVAILFIYKNILAQPYAVQGVNIVEYDLCTCQSTVVASSSNNVYAGVAVDGNENFYALTASMVGNPTHDILFVDASTGNTTFIVNINLVTGTPVLGPDGLLYIIQNLPTDLLSIDPATGTVTSIGTFPAGYNPDDLFFWNGQLFGTAVVGGQHVIIQIPIADPAASTITYTFPANVNLFSLVVINVDGVDRIYFTAFIGSSGVGVYELDLTTGNITLVCPNLFTSDFSTQLNATLPPCCNNEAGSLTDYEPIEVCENASATVPHNDDEDLISGSELFFILVSDTASALPISVLALNDAPTFSFNAATMMLSTYYYIAAVAAPEQNGAPDWSSDCIDRTFYVPVRWNPLPTVAILSQSQPTCGEDCVTLELALTGNFPITLTWQTGLAAPNDTGTWEADGSPASFTICPPAGGAFPTGSFDFQLTGIGDAFCACP